MLPSLPQAVFLNGTVISLSTEFVRALMRHYRFQLFVLGAINLFIVLQPYKAQNLERWQAITIISTVGLIVVGTYCLSFLCWASVPWLWRRGRLRTYWVLMGTAIMSAVIGQASLLPFGSQPRSAVETGLISVFHMIMFAGLEIIFAIFVLPEVLASMRARPVSGQGAAPVSDTNGPREGQTEQGGSGPLETPIQSSGAVGPRIVVVSDQRFEARSIRWVMSQEHYISVMTHDTQTRFVRGRMRDFLNQIPDELGYSIHRSHWVSWEAIQRVHVEKDMMFVMLDEKTQLPVARGRRTDFIARWKRRSASAA